MKSESNLLLGFDQVVDIFVDDRTVFFVLLVQHFTILKMLDQTTQALQTCVGQIADLFTAKTQPSLALEQLIKPEQMLCANKIDESVAYVAKVLEVAGEIEKVVTVFQKIIYLIGEVLHSVFVRNITDHDRGAGVRFNILLLYLELRVRLNSLLVTNRFGQLLEAVVVVILGQGVAGGVVVVGGWVDSAGVAL